MLPHRSSLLWFCLGVSSWCLLVLSLRLLRPRSQPSPAKLPQLQPLLSSLPKRSTSAVSPWSPVVDTDAPHVVSGIVHDYTWVNGHLVKLPSSSGRTLNVDGSHSW